MPYWRVGWIRVTHPCAGRRQRYCYRLDAPRLACVKPVASVHPEPGSNSSLYILYLRDARNRTRSCWSVPGQPIRYQVKSSLPQYIIDGSFLLPSSPVKGCCFLYYYFCLCKSFKELFPLALPTLLVSKAGAKVRTLQQTTKLFRDFFRFRAQLF